MNRRADASCFGLDFQANAAILLTLENMRTLDYVRLESDEEDISIRLNNGNFILAQAKSVQKASQDFKNVRRNLESALKTLSEGEKKVSEKGASVEKLILITNSMNPLNEELSRGAFLGGGKRDYADLPPSAQKIIEDFLSKITEPLNANSFRIQVFSFETDMEDERYKVVLDKIRDFTSSMRLHSLEPARLMKIWQRDFFVNASKHDSYIMLKKKDVIWPILVIITDIDGIQESMEDALDMDQGEYEEVIYHYRDLINVQCERFRSFTRVITDYSLFEKENKSRPSERIKNFINQKWASYLDDFSPGSIEIEIREKLVKIILYTILQRRYQIQRVKTQVNLTVD